MKKIISGVGSFSLALFLAACGGAATQPPTGDSTAPGVNSTAVGSSSGLESTPATGIDPMATSPATGVDPMATSPAAGTGATDSAGSTTGTDTGPTSAASAATASAGDTAGTSATTTTGGTAGTSATTTGGTAGTSATTTTGGAMADLGDLTSDPRFTTLNGLLTTTGLDQQLAALGPFTLFAPTNEAFAALPAGTLEALSQNPSLLQEILLYHVANESIRSTDITDTTTAETVAGEELTVRSSDGEVLVNNTARVVEADISAGQGVIHAIDEVLLPPGVALGS